MSFNRNGRRHSHPVREDSTQVSREVEDPVPKPFAFKFECRTVALVAAGESFAHQMGSFFLSVRDYLSSNSRVQVTVFVW